MTEPKLRILLVEDNPGDARLVREALLQGPSPQFELTWVSDLAAGIRHLGENVVDAILLDFSLPDGQGMQLLEKIQTKASQVPIVILTGRQDEEAAFAAVRGGAQDYLIKGQVDGSLISRAIHYAIERKRIEEERAANLERLKELERLRDVDRFKSQLINIVAHELGTPLTPIKLQLHILEALETFGGDPKARNALDSLHRNVDRLSVIVQDVLDASRIEAGRFGVEHVEVDLARVVQASGQPYVLQCQRSSHALTIRTEPDLVVRGDAARLIRVVGSFLSNAVKFTPPGGSIVVEAVREGENAVVRVRDTGAGLTPKQIGQLFHPFAQVHDPMQKTEAGSGLELYISRRIIERHEGRIWCDSPGPGRGCTFAFALPLEQQAVRASEPRAGEVPPARTR